MQRRNNQTKRTNSTPGEAITGNPARSLYKATGNFAKPGWGYHPTKGLRRVRVYG